MDTFELRLQQKLGQITQQEREEDQKTVHVQDERQWISPEESYFDTLKTMDSRTVLVDGNHSSATLEPVLADNANMSKKDRSKLRNRTIKNREEGKAIVGRHATSQTVPLMKSMKNREKLVKKGKIKLTEEITDIAYMQIPANIFDVVLTKERSHFDVKSALSIRDQLNKIAAFKEKNPEEYLNLDVETYIRLEELLAQKRGFEETLRVVLGANGLDMESNPLSEEEIKTCRLQFAAHKEAFSENMFQIQQAHAAMIGDERQKRLDRADFINKEFNEGTAMRDVVISKWNSFQTLDSAFMELKPGFLTSDFHARSIHRMQVGDETASYWRLKDELISYILQSGHPSDEERDALYADVKPRLTVEYHDFITRAIPMVEAMKNASALEQMEHMEEICSLELSGMHLSDITRLDKKTDGTSVMSELGYSEREQQEIRRTVTYLSVLRERLILLSMKPGFDAGLKVNATKACATLSKMSGRKQDADGNVDGDEVKEFAARKSLEMSHRLTGLLEAEKFDREFDKIETEEQQQSYVSKLSVTLRTMDRWLGNPPDLTKLDSSFNYKGLVARIQNAQAAFRTLTGIRRGETPDYSEIANRVSKMSPEATARITAESNESKRIEREILDNPKYKGRWTAISSVGRRDVSAMCKSAEKHLTEDQIVHFLDSYNTLCMENGTNPPPANAFMLPHDEAVAQMVSSLNELIDEEIATLDHMDFKEPVCREELVVMMAKCTPSFAHLQHIVYMARSDADVMNFIDQEKYQRLHAYKQYLGDLIDLCMGLADTSQSEFGTTIFVRTKGKISYKDPTVSAAYRELLREEDSHEVERLTQKRTVNTSIREARTIRRQDLAHRTEVENQIQSELKTHFDEVMRTAAETGININDPNVYLTRDQIEKSSTDLIQKFIKSGYRLKGMAGEMDEEAAKTKLQAFLRELGNANCFDHIDEKGNFQYNQAEFSYEEIVDLLDHRSAEKVRSFIRPLMEFDPTAFLAETRFCNSETTMEERFRMLPAVHQRLHKLLALKQWAEKFASHDMMDETFETEFAIAVGKFQMITDIVYRGLLPDRNFSFAEAVEYGVNEFEKNKECTEREKEFKAAMTQAHEEREQTRAKDEYTREELQAINITGDGIGIMNAVTKRVDGKQVCVPGIARSEYQKIADGDLGFADELAAELQSLKFTTQTDRARVCGMEDAGTLIAYGKEDLLYYAELQRKSVLFQAMRKTHKGLFEGHFDQETLDNLTKVQAKIRNLYYGLSNKMKNPDYPGTNIRIDLGQGMPDPNWFFAEMDKELFSKESKKAKI